MLEIAALVAGLIGASASAISAVKDSRDMSSANNSQLSLVPYNDSYTQFQPLPRQSFVQAYGTAGVHINANGGITAWSSGAGSSCVGYTGF
ncbi:hypothetical protein F5882DRAFT_463981 [Hyaloscypha sp. PMI_1271]|nr:hypothetical protein F5882DRAFT_463981 [Hyaloscypha sp. PMI_1271]